MHYINVSAETETVSVCQIMIFYRLLKKAVSVSLLKKHKNVIFSLTYVYIYNAYTETQYIHIQKLNKIR